MNTTLNLWYVNVTLDYAKNVSGETTSLCSLTAEYARHVLLWIPAACKCYSLLCQKCDWGNHINWSSDCRNVQGMHYCEFQLPQPNSPHLHYTIAIHNITLGSITPDLTYLCTLPTSSYTKSCYYNNKPVWVHIACMVGITYIWGYQNSLLLTPPSWYDGTI